MKLAEHQRVAAVRIRQLLEEYGGAILADEPGLGKSFVAAMVARDSEIPVELIVPAGLVPQWRATLAECDVEAASIVTHDGLASRPFVPEPSRRRLVIVDEAHAFRNPKTARHAALARTSVGARMLLVTATPICNSPRDLHALLSLVAGDDVLWAAGVPSIDLAFEHGDRAAVAVILERLVIRRGRSVLPVELDFALPLRSIVKHELFDPGGEVGRLIDALEFPLVGSAPLLRRLLWRRLESSEAALLESIRRQLRFYDRASDSLAHGRTLSKRDYVRAFGRERDEEAIQQVLFWDLWAPPASNVTRAAIEREVACLESLRAVIERSPCEKRRQMLRLATNEREPTIVFTSAAATARDLHEVLRQARRSGVATSRDGRGAVDAFVRGAIDVLVATDLASEGLNLQRAGAVVHYDIPWNPVKIDQRNGRACRIGQRRDSVRAIYFVPAHDATRIVAVVGGKNRVRRKVLEAASGGARPATHLPPRVTRASAVVQFLAAAEKAGFTSLPARLERRHKTGMERLLDEMSREYLDAKRIDYLLAIAADERG